MIGDTLSSQNTDTLSLLQQNRLVRQRQTVIACSWPIFMLYKRLILALKEPLSPTLPVRMMLLR